MRSPVVPSESFKRPLSILDNDDSSPSSPSSNLVIVPFENPEFSEQISVVARHSAKRSKKSQNYDSNIEAVEDRSDLILEEEFFDDEDMKDYEWIEYLAEQKSQDNRSQLLELMQRLNVYDGEQLHLALRKLHQSPSHAAEIEALYPRPAVRSVSCPLSPSRSVAALEFAIDSGHRSSS